MDYIQSNIPVLILGIVLLLIAFKVIRQINVVSVICAVYGFIFAVGSGFTLLQLSA